MIFRILEDQYAQKSKEAKEQARAADQRFMQLALALGRRGLGRTWPNPAVGAVVVKDGVIIGRGWTQPGGRPHAETEALARAGDAARGATLYVTLEPCSHHGKTPPCADAIIAACVARVVSALVDPNPEVAGAGHWRIADAGVVVEVGIGAADGKVALAGRKPARITGEAAAAHVHLMRAMNDAVLTGIGTVLSDDPLLTCRLSGMGERSPVRVVLDTMLRLPPGGRLAHSARQAPLWVMAGEGAPREREQALTAAGIVVLRGPRTRERLDLVAVLTLLGGRSITRLMIEAGPIGAAAFLRANLVDEATLLRSPSAVGADGIDALDGLPLSALTQSPRLKSLGGEAVGADMIETFERM